ncbi:hypothetical protein BDV39DRAFT_112398 [Aspergillus sergii]|uniref:Uncharacterized protein n=1 Tax=Aspergillus sergii TaxID=1034303 RepID=A0A5N6WWN3_9EURO|nr:hypothetical protein BDV39DRAFT_112398 [Aspergillus sergii]
MHPISLPCLARRFLTEVYSLLYVQSKQVYYVSKVCTSGSTYLQCSSSMRSFIICLSEQPLTLTQITVRCSRADNKRDSKERLVPFTRVPRYSHGFLRQRHMGAHSGKKISGNHQDRYYFPAHW